MVYKLTMYIGSLHQCLRNKEKRGIHIHEFTALLKKLQQEFSITKVYVPSLFF